MKNPQSIEKRLSIKHKMCRTDYRTKKKNKTTIKSKKRRKKTTSSNKIIEKTPRSLRPHPTRVGIELKPLKPPSTNLKPPKEEKKHLSKSLTKSRKKTHSVID